nr:immunoglobulin light chain junction region [Macaca mulatta]MOV92241.1 immunoglobulin light chain junction region [Macaca mulatta]MOV92291.1 immunoglobulin light chain junction region [Macaca mulatta]MOV92354.1 immunoglobulin light chain junction region [Macaca mulatta]MOV92403.1 immunoglobulin light chain junction region [Macaca mulatta]
CLQHKDYPLTF